jgi:hypothetical protein
MKRAVEWVVIVLGFAAIIVCLLALGYCMVNGMLIA